MRNCSLFTSSTWAGDIAGSVGFVYNNDFRVTSESINGGNAVNYSYDDGLLTGVGSLVINRDAGSGSITVTTLGNVTDSLSYNGYGEPATYTASYDGSPVLGIQYTRDDLGRITQKAETINDQTDNYEYFYDLAGRLTDVKKDSVNISHYEYDTNGNRIGYNNSITGTYDNQDRLIAYGNYSYTYTDNGELAARSGPSGTTQYSYDNFGNLKVVMLPTGSEIDYIVDGQNRRVGKKINGALTQGFLYEDQLRPVVELDGSGNVVSRFVYGTKINVPDYMIKNGVTYRIITDHLGSPRFVVDVNSGAIVQQMNYDEFGNITQDTNPGFQPFGFAGGIYDRDTGLARFGARDYDPLTGKWTAKDPIGFSGGDTNLFGYAVADPVNGLDPLGLAEPLIYGTPGTQPAPDAPNLGKLVEILNGFGKAALGIKAMKQADEAILELQKTIPFGKERDILILYGTRPVRFVGLANQGDDLLLNSDVRKFPTTIEGLRGLEKLPITPAAVGVLKWPEKRSNKPCP